VTKRQVGLFKTPRQLRFHGAQFHGVAAGFKNSQDALAFSNLPSKAIKRGANGCGVVCKIVINRDACHTAAHFHSALHVLKACKC